MSLLDADLPAGSRWIRLGDAFQLTRKPRHLQLPPEVAFLPMETLPQGGRRDFQFEMRPLAKLTSGTYFERGDVLVAKITPSFENGKRALTTVFPFAFGYATTEVIPLRPIGDRDPRFLFYYLLHPDVCGYVAEKMEGATGRQRVPDHVLLDLQFPDIEDESKIADVLELVQDAIQAETNSLAKSAQLKTAAIRELFTRGLRGQTQQESAIGALPHGWALSNINEHFELQSGGTPSRSVSAYWEHGTIPWVKTGEISYRIIDATEESITSVGLANSAAKLFPSGTLVMAMYGQGVTRGKVGILGITAACNQACAAFLPKDDAVSVRLLFHYLTYSYERLRAMSHGGQQQNLNMDIVGEFRIAFPPDPREQQEIVRVLDAIDDKITIHEKKRSALESLFQSLLHKLMSGEIRVADLDLSALRPSPDEVTA